jgi:hypothetical protein
MSSIQQGTSTHLLSPTNKRNLQRKLLTSHSNQSLLNFTLVHFLTIHGNSPRAVSSPPTTLAFAALSSSSSPSPSPFPPGLPVLLSSSGLVLMTVEEAIGTFTGPHEPSASGSALISNDATMMLGTWLGFGEWVLSRHQMYTSSAFNKIKYFIFQYISLI